MATEFINHAKGLTKNPLGIIALFISLIYGFSCLVLSVSLENLRGVSERLPLIWFIIIFPVLILGGFIYLVVTNHQKLYAPSDYKDETNFFKGFGKGQTVQAIDAPAEDEEVELLLLNSSIKGLYALYAVYLAYVYNIKFTLKDLESHSSLLTEEYTHGFLVATSSFGVFALRSVEMPFSIVHISPILAEKIKDICYQHAEINRTENNSEYLYDQLAQIERAFEKVSEIKFEEEPVTT